MRTTIELPDDLFRRVKARAALDGVTLREMITRFVSQGMRVGSEPPAPDARRARSPIPVARARTGKTLPVLTNEELHRVLDQDELPRASER